LISRERKRQRIAVLETERLTKRNSTEDLYEDGGVSRLIALECDTGITPSDQNVGESQSPTAGAVIAPHCGAEVGFGSIPFERRIERLVEP
jgi:hypothetical protein